MTGDREPAGERGDRLSRLRAATRWRNVFRDVAFVSAWVLVLSFGWGYMRWPTWAYYVVVFGGIVAYSLTFDL